jgi:hypothetical protein
MAVAFGGLMGSSFPILNQLSFFLCVAVLLDTFVVRAVLVPALMSLAGEYAWWPRKHALPWSAEGYDDATAAAAGAPFAAASGGAPDRRLASIAAGPPRPIYVEVRHPRIAAGGADSQHWVYEVCCLQKQQLDDGFEVADVKWSVLRRYSEFATLNDHLGASLGWQMPAVAFPPKAVFASNSKAFIEDRRAALQAWLQAIVAVKNITHFASHLGSLGLYDFLNFDSCRGGMVVRASDDARVAEANSAAAAEEGVCVRARALGLAAAAAAAVAAAAACAGGQVRNSACFVSVRSGGGRPAPVIASSAAGVRGAQPAGGRC